MIAATLCLGVIASGSNSAWAKKPEKRKARKKDRIVTLKQMPELARARIIDEAGDNKIDKKIEQEKEGGGASYEAKWTAAGKAVEVKVAPNGKLLEKETDDNDDGDDDDDDD